MTVCIALLADGGRKIICVTDEKVSFSGFSADNLTFKNEPLVGTSVALCAGNDMQYAPIILERARKSLTPQSSPSEAAYAVDDAYHDQLSELIQKRILKRYRIDADTFVRRGRKLFTEAVYNRLCERIERVTISAKFLVCGHDSSGIGHLFTAGGEASVENFDHIGLWSIGSGAASALASLSFHATHKHLIPRYADLHSALYFALEAKFMAESENTVGESTFVVVFEKGQLPKFVAEAAVPKIKKAWLRSGAPRQSKKVVTLIDELLYDYREVTDEEGALRAIDARLGKRAGYSKKLLERVRAKRLVSQTPEDQQ